MQSVIDLKIIWFYYSNQNKHGDVYNDYSHRLIVLPPVNCAKSLCFNLISRIAVAATCMNPVPFATKKEEGNRRDRLSLCCNKNHDHIVVVVADTLYYGVPFLYKYTTFYSYTTDTHTTTTNTRNTFVFHCCVDVVVVSSIVFVDRDWWWWGWGC